MTDTLAGRNVVVTGGTGGLGRAVVARLAEIGAICHLPVRHADAGAIVAPAGLVHLVAGIDLTDEAAVGAFYDAVPDLWASVHLAGGFAMAPLADTTGAEFLKMVEINTLTAFICSRAAVRGMRRTGQGGRIVNVAARPGIDPRRGSGMAAYAASKAAVAAITLALAEELKNERILVNAIAPSTLDTAANRAAMPKADPGRWLSLPAATAAILQLIAPSNLEVSGAVLPLFARA